MTISAVFARLFNILGQMLAPVQPSPARSAVVWNYLILTIKATFFGKRRPDRVRVLGRFVSPDSYALLRVLFVEIFVRREYEFVATREDPLIIDCGGNIGIATLFFSMQYPKARIVTMEPSPGSFVRLRKMKDWNKLDRVELHNVAVARSDGHIDLYYDEMHPASVEASLSPNRGGPVAVQVRAVRLSTFITEEVDLLKIDIEGAEMEVLDELAASGKLNKVRQIAVEFHHHVEPNENRLSQFLKLFEANGFGYQIRTATQRPVQLGSFQDVMIYAYRMGASPAQYR